MLNYRKISAVFILLMIALLITDSFSQLNILLYPGIFIVYVGWLIYGSIYIKSNFYCRVYCSANTDKKVIALSFDDGPDKTVTPMVLDVLREHNVKAAFYCIGNKAEKNRALIKKIDHDGHVIGSHSYSHHFFFDFFGSGKISDELQKTENILHEILDKKITMFRPPYGVTNPLLAKALLEKKYHVIGWSLRSKDTVIKKEEQLYRRLIKKIKPGSIVLFHDTKPHIVKVLDKFIIFAKDNNYSIELPDKLLGIDAYE